VAYQGKGTPHSPHDSRVLVFNAAHTPNKETRQPPMTGRAVIPIYNGTGKLVAHKGGEFSNPHTSCSAELIGRKRTLIRMWCSSSHNRRSNLEAVTFGLGNAECDGFKISSSSERNIAITESSLDNFEY